MPYLQKMKDYGDSVHGLSGQRKGIKILGIFTVKHHKGGIETMKGDVYARSRPCTGNNPQR